jgi:hypothetical protein
MSIIALMARSLALWTLLVGFAGAAVGAAVTALVSPHPSLQRLGLAACVGALVLLPIWTATVLVPRRPGESPWPLIRKALVFGPVLGVTAGGACLVIDHETPVAFLAGGAIAGIAIVPWLSASAWAAKSAAD